MRTHVQIRRSITRSALILGMLCLATAGFLGDKASTAEENNAAKANEVPKAQPTDTGIIVDNTEAVIVGAWMLGRSGGFYKRDYHFKGDGVGTASATFVPDLPADGDYDVYEWHVAGSNRFYDATHVIKFRDGETTVRVDQQVNGSQWNFLGTFTFAAGKAGSVKITDATANSGHGLMIMADAIRFVPAERRANPSKETQTLVSFRDQSSSSAGQEKKTEAPKENIYAPKAPEPETGIIVDNRDAVIVGSWLPGRSGGRYGRDYLFKGNGPGNGTVTFTPDLPADGDYQVYEWHVGGANRAFDVPHIIKFRDGEKVLYVDQQPNAAQWNLLGTFTFAAGTNGNVKITDGASIMGQMIMADAIRFVSVEKGATTSKEKEIKK
jgi:hypothetical protein